MSGLNWDGWSPVAIYHLVGFAGPISVLFITRGAYVQIWAPVSLCCFAASGALASVWDFHPMVR
jgi:hypothetical protein